MIEVPAVVRRKALAADAEQWLADLDDLVAAISQQWGLTLGRVFQDGTEALVTEATLADGTAAVLKLLVPRGDDVAAHEITVLRLANGEGCARLLRADATTGALLLERLGPSLHDLGLPLAARLEILCDAAARVWRPAADAGLPTGARVGTSSRRRVAELRLARPDLVCGLLLGNVDSRIRKVLDGQDRADAAGSQQRRKLFLFRCHGEASREDPGPGIMLGIAERGMMAPG